MLTGEDLRKRFPQAHDMIIQLVLVGLKRDGRELTSLSKEEVQQRFRDAEKHFMETVTFVKQAARK